MRDKTCIIYTCICWSTATKIFRRRYTDSKTSFHHTEKKRTGGLKEKSGGYAVAFFVKKADQERFVSVLSASPGALPNRYST